MKNNILYFFIIVIILNFSNSYSQTKFNIYEIGKGEILKKDFQFLEYLYDDLLSATPITPGIENYIFENLTGVIDFQENTIVPFQYRNIRQLRNFNYYDRKNIHKLVTIYTKYGVELYYLTKSEFKKLNSFSTYNYHYIPSNNDIIFTSGATKNYIINLKTNKIDSTELDINSFLSGELIIFTKNKKNGILNINGNIVIPAVNKGIMPYNDSLIKISKGLKGDTVGIINHKGEIILPPIFSEVPDYAEGQNRIFARTFNNGKKLNFDSKVIEEISDWTATFNKPPHKLYALNDKQIQQLGLVGVFDFAGNLVIPFEYDYMEKGIKTEIIASKDKKTGIISDQGKILFDFKYDDINLSFDNFYVVKLNKMKGLFSNNGKQIFGIEYQEVFPISSNKILLLKENNWYICNINKSKKLTKINLDPDFKLEYLLTYPYDPKNIKERKFNQNEYFQISKGNKYGILDYNLKIIIPPIHKQSPTLLFGKYYNFGYGNSAVLYTKNGNKMEGIQEVDYNYESELFPNTIICIKNGKFGVVDLDMNVLIPFIYSSIQNINGHKFIVQK